MQQGHDMQLNIVKIEILHYNNDPVWKGKIFGQEFQSCIFWHIYSHKSQKKIALHFDLIQHEIITPIGYFGKGLMQYKRNSFRIPLFAYPLDITINHGNLCLNIRKNINQLFPCSVNVHSNPVYTF